MSYDYYIKIILHLNSTVEIKKKKRNVSGPYIQTMWSNVVRHFQFSLSILYAKFYNF